MYLLQDPPVQKSTVREIGSKINKGNVFWRKTAKRKIKKELGEWNRERYEEGGYKRWGCGTPS